MPASAILLSILALAPFIGCGLGALAPDAATAARMLTGLIGWGAVVLAFVGGMHWGLVMRSPDAAAGTALTAGGADKQRHAHIGLAALPLILGWVALMLPLITTYWLGLLVLIAAYVAVLMIEHRCSARLLLPARYLTVRWGFTIIAVAMLTTGPTLRLLGQTIVL